MDPIRFENIRYIDTCCYELINFIVLHDITCRIEYIVLFLCTYKYEIPI